MPEFDPKPRSRTVTDGIEAMTSRGMLRAVGMGDADWDKPQIGIASSWNEITPCNLSLGRLARDEREVHALMAHRDAVGDGHRAELQRVAPTAVNALLRGLREATE